MVLTAARHPGVVNHRSIMTKEYRMYKSCGRRMLKILSHIAFPAAFRSMSLLIGVCEAERSTFLKEQTIATAGN